MTIREMIFAEIEARLAAIDGVALVERMPSGDPDVFDALAIFDGAQRPIEQGCDYTRHEMVPTIEGYVEGFDGSEAHAAISALYAAVVRALMSDQPPLGGLADEITEGDLRISVARLASTERLGFSLDFSIQFTTARGDPALSG